MDPVSTNASYDKFCPPGGGNYSYTLATWEEYAVEGNRGNYSEIYGSCNCTTWHLDTKDADPIAIIRIITSIFSVVGAASIILLVLLTGKLNTAEVHPLFMLSVGDFILAILWLIGGVVWLSPDKYGWAKEESTSHAGMCYVLAVATTMVELVTFFLTVVYAQSALMRIREVYINKGKTLGEKDGMKHFRHIVTGSSYVISWVLPLIIVLPVTEVKVGIDATNKGCWCIVDFFNLRPDDGALYRNSSFNKFAIIQSSIIGPSFIFTSVLIIICYVFTFFYARRVAHIQMEQQRQGGKSQKMIKSIIIRLTFFILIFLICGGPSMAAAIAVWSEQDRLHLNEPVDRTILYIHAFLAPMQGFLNAIVYGWSRQEFRKAVKVSNRIKFSKQHSRQRNSHSHYESLNNSRISPGNLNYNSETT